MGRGKNKYSAKSVLLDRSIKTKRSPSSLSKPVILFPVEKYFQSRFSPNLPYSVFKDDIVNELLATKEDLKRNLSQKREKTIKRIDGVLHMIDHEEKLIKIIEELKYILADPNAAKSGQDFRGLGQTIRPLILPDKEALIMNKLTEDGDYKEKISLGNNQYDWDLIKSLCDNLFFNGSDILDSEGYTKLAQSNIGSSIIEHDQFTVLMTLLENSGYLNLKRENDWGKILAYRFTPKMGTVLPYFYRDADDIFPFIRKEL